MEDGARRMGPRMQFLIGIYCLAALVACLGILVGLLPRGGASLELGARWLLLVAAAGGLGASIHAATSFSSHAGLNTLGQEWAWWYVLRPVLGIGLGVLFVVAVTGLRLEEAAKSLDGNDMRSLAGYLALAGLAGMFSRQAIDWLAVVFSSVLQVMGKTDTSGKKAPQKGEDSSAQGRQEAPSSAGAPPPAPPAPTEPKEDAYGPPWRRLVPIYILAAVLLLAATIALACLTLTWLPLQPDVEYLVLLLVASAAALGSTIHIFTSIAEFAGREELRRRWLWWYTLRPFIAAALGLLLYFGVRALWIESLKTSSQMYTVLVFSFLAGAFSKQTIRWVSGLYDAFFRRVENLEQGDKT